MSDFFNLSDGSQIEHQDNFETGGGNIEPIPAKTELLAMIDEAKIDSNDDLGRFISLRWRVAKPEEYQNRIVFQKVKVWDVDTKKADKAKKMLAAIDTNCGGNLIASGQEPTDESLMRYLANNLMMIRVMVWEMEVNGEEKSGNWVSAVGPATQTLNQAPPTATEKELSGNNIPF